MMLISVLGADSEMLCLARAPHRTWRLTCLSDTGFAAAIACEPDADDLAGDHVCRGDDPA